MNIQNIISNKFDLNWSTSFSYMSFTLSVTNKPFQVSVVMLNVIMLNIVALKIRLDLKNGENVDQPEEEDVVFEPVWLKVRSVKGESGALL
jgi:hypothetical protein